MRARRWATTLVTAVLGVAVLGACGTRADGRMAAQEQHGWYQLATRVLDRLPSGGGTAVQTAVGALQEAAPAVPSGASAESTGVRSPAWSAAEVDLAAACEEIGSPRSEEHTS